VARAEPAAEVARARDGHAAQVGANGHAHQPLGLCSMQQTKICHKKAKQAKKYKKRKSSSGTQ
jgi:hypothetical protein